MAGIDLAEHRRQVEAYIRQRPEYVAFAHVLRRVLEMGCRAAFPTALVQTRAKDVSSFAEKAARKADKYHDPVNQLTDLCGGRVTVQTLEQVKAVRHFIEANFAILEQDDKSQRLEEDRFGYRDMHYIVQLRADRDLGITPEELAAIGTRKAEIQVRTWVQHAWADTLHDRIYKTPLRLSAETRRLANLLAAVLEDGDRTFDRLASQTDEMRANYSAHAARGDVEKEVAVMEAVLANLPADAEPVEITLRLARLLGSARGEYQKVAELLLPLEKTEGPLRREVLTELGFALCKAHAAAPASTAYAQGRALLRAALELGARHNGAAAVDAGRSRSLQARGWSRLGWTHAHAPEFRPDALACYRKALELAPANPYYLADVLGFEVAAAGPAALTTSARIAVTAALHTCREHALAGIEMPYACFTAGRLHVLLGEGGAALAWYARGLSHCRQESACVPVDVLENERAFAERAGPVEAAAWVKGLLTLAEATRQPDPMAQWRQMVPADAPRWTGPALIVSGGAASLSPELIGPIRQMLTIALDDFAGTVISGGTRSGAPGCLGDAAGDLAARGRKSFALAGYLPEKLPTEVALDERYDRHVGCGAAFSVEQVLRMWADLFASGITPSEVQLLGFGGGQISALEYRIALALGATVGLMMKSGGTAEGLLADELWAGEPRLLPLPGDGQTIRAFVHASRTALAEGPVEAMGREFHQRYLARHAKQAPSDVRPWEELDETYRTASRQQAREVINILEAAGFGVRLAKETGAFDGFTQEELERLAALEHGRWNVERLRAGWRPGASRDNTRKVHNLILPWGDKALDRYRQEDVESVRAMPEILAKAGLEVYRKR